MIVYRLEELTAFEAEESTLREDLVITVNTVAECKHIVIVLIIVDLVGNYSLGC